MTVYSTDSVAMPDISTPKRRKASESISEKVSAEKSAENKLLVPIRRGRREMFRKVRQPTLRSFGRHV